MAGGGWRSYLSSCVLGFFSYLCVVLLSSTYLVLLCVIPCFFFPVLGRMWSSPFCSPFDNIPHCRTLRASPIKRVCKVWGVFGRGGRRAFIPLLSPPFFFPYHGAFFSSWGGCGTFICTCLACRCDNILLCHTLCIPYRERVQGVGCAGMSGGGRSYLSSLPFFFSIPWCFFLLVGRTRYFHMYVSSMSVR